MIDKNAGTLYTTNTEEISKLLKILDEMEARTREAIELARELEELVRSVVTVDGMPPGQPMNLTDSQSSPENIPFTALLSARSRALTCL